MVASGGHSRATVDSATSKSRWRLHHESRRDTLRVPFRTAHLADGGGVALGGELTYSVPASPGVYRNLCSAPMRTKSATDGGELMVSDFLTSRPPKDRRSNQRCAQTQLKTSAYDLGRRLQIRPAKHHDVVTHDAGLIRFQLARRHSARRDAGTIGGPDAHGYAVRLDVYAIDLVGIATR